MKKLLLVVMLLGSSLTFAHDHTQEEKREVYEFIQTQLKEGQITVSTAQKMWLSYIRCCK